MRPVLVLAILLVLPAASAQVPAVNSATVTLGGLGAAMHETGTQHSMPVAVTVDLAQPTCPAGGVVHITLDATTTASNVTVAVAGGDMSFGISSSDGLMGATLTQTATVIVDAGLVAANKTVTVDISATGTGTCVPAGSVAVTGASGNQTVVFGAITGAFSSATSQDALPGFEGVFLVAALAAAAIVMRRKA